ncbi:MAG: DUF1697 domain-containing protein [Ilumatobacteraceae bacterium]
MRWVVLLRGINVGGANRLPMAELRGSVESIGATEVATYIQSGNLVLTDDRSEGELIDALHDTILERHGLDLAVVVRSADEMVRIAAQHPEADRHIDHKFVYVTFLDRAPTEQAIAELDPDAHLPDRWTIDGRELFVVYPLGSGRSKLTIERFERAWGVTATARNMNTVRKLAGMV